MIGLSSFTDRWPMVTLGDAVEFLDHRRRPVKESDRKAGPIPYYGANGLQGMIDNFLFDEPLVLLAEDGGHFGIPDRTIAYQVEGKCWVNNHAHVLRPKPITDYRYLTRVLEHYDVTPFITGSTRAKLTKGSAAKIEIPLPPIDEQRRIAAVLDKADAIRRQRKESLQLTEKLLQSIFLDMFVKNPEISNWQPQTIEWMATGEKGAIRTGPFGSQLLHSEFVDSGIAVLGIDNAVQNRFEWSRLRFIAPEKYQNLKRYKVFPGDLIVTIMGTLGRCAIVPEDIPEAINTKHLCCITLDRKKCHPEFLHACLLHHPDILRQLGVRTKGAVMPGLNMGIIKALELPLPPLDLQEKFKRIVSDTTRVRIDSEKSQQSMENLFGSIQQRAFRGELDLSRLKIDDEIEISEQIAIPEPMITEGKYKRPGCFIATPDIEALLMALEEQLEYGHDDFIPWSEDYFKYRILSQVLEPPFSFNEIMEEVYNDMPEASYETVKTKVFEYLAEGILEQRFDEVRQEIVFYPRP